MKRQFFLYLFTTLLIISSAAGKENKKIIKDEYKTVFSRKILYSKKDIEEALKKTTNIKYDNDNEKQESSTPLISHENSSSTISSNTDNSEDDHQLSIENLQNIIQTTEDASSDTASHSEITTTDQTQNQFVTAEKLDQPKVHAKKPWNLIIYMLSTNNIYKYTLHNLKQMLEIGSTQYINVIVNISQLGEEESTQFYVKPNHAELQHINSEGFLPQEGTVESLYMFIKWATLRYPAERTALVLWNHSSGIKNPSLWDKIYKNERNHLFLMNPETGLFELNRASTITNINKNDKNETEWHTFSQRDKKKLPLYIETTKRKNRTKSVIDQINTQNQQELIWHSSFQKKKMTGFSHKELRTCLEKVCEEILHKKIDIILMDACHQGMIEFASKLKTVTNFLVASQEIEPSNGFNYRYLLQPFLTKSLSPSQFAIHAVGAYEKEYGKTLADYTLSAINLDYFQDIDMLITRFCNLFIELLNQNNDYFFMLKNIRSNPKNVTEFFDRDYIDFLHCLRNILINLQRFKPNLIYGGISKEENSDINKLEQLGFTIIKNLEERVIAHTAGTNLPFAKGLSIYFPQKSIHASYHKTSFAYNTTWSKFLEVYLRKLKELGTY